MGWPSKLYCATKTLGVYYTSNFSDPSIQPTWTAVNGGLPATDVRQFALDPFDNAAKQYLLLEASCALYRRDNGGNWATILTNADLDTLCGDTNMNARWFRVDKSVPGRLWVLARATDNGWTYACYSDDYGASWTAINMGFWAYYLPDGIEVWGDTVFVENTTGVAKTIYYSTNKGASWAGAGIGNANTKLGFNPLQPTLCYFGIYISTCTNAGVTAQLTNTNVMCRGDGIWFSGITALHQRNIDGGNIYVTNDNWTTVNSAGLITPSPECFAPWAGTDEDQMIVGLVIVHTFYDHVIGCLYGEADTTATGIAGTNCSTTPFADSIPDTCGGVAIGGIAALGIAPHIYVGHVEFE